MFQEVRTGLAKQTDNEGDGILFPREVDEVHVHYSCTLEGARDTIDSTRGEHQSTVGGITVCKAKKPLRLILGDSCDMIKGFQMAVCSMSLGERATFKIQSNLAYGSEGKGNVVPPDTNLVFEIELLGINKAYVRGR
jgi:FKBP-type peptidyl-prolyl cis-trans isomerase